MEINQTKVFQTDSDIIINYFNTNNNYLIEFNHNVKKEYCAIYFSSNDLYYPNTENSFRETVISKNRYEWYNNRINYANKHIFIRDIQKQWYLGGINIQINTPYKIYEFLRKELEGYKSIFIGSSAGGFVSIIIGQLLNAERIFSFNGQFELNSILYHSNAIKDPLIFRNKNNQDMLKYFDARNFIVNPEKIFYFQSTRSAWDIEQATLINNLELNHIMFNSSNHGLPFYRFSVESILNSDLKGLLILKSKINSPFTYSTNQIGIINTVINLTSLYFRYLFKFSKRKFFSLFTLK